MNQISVSKHQAAFIGAKTRGRIYLGSIGSGKTRVLCYSAILDCLQGRNSAIVSFNYRNLKDVVLRTLKECADQMEIPHTENNSDMTFSLYGRPILLRSADNHDKLRSYNLSTVYMEEAREMTNEVFEILLGRLREGENASWALVSTTNGKNWFYDIIKREGLEYIFNDDSYLAQNEQLTVVRSTIDDSPFLPKAYVKELKRTYSSNFQQQELFAKIIDTQGSIIDSKWFKYGDFSYKEGIRFWDIATTTKDTSDYSSGVLMKRSNEGKYYISDIINVKLSYPDLKKLIIKTAINDTDNVIIGFEQAGQQQLVIDDFRRLPELSQFNIKTYHPTKDKLSRGYPFISQIELGNVVLNKDSWNKPFIDQCTSFSKENIGKSQYHDDMIDACISAYNILTKNNSIVTTRW